MKLNPGHLEIYFIMGSVNCKKDLRHVLEEALQGGVTMFQFREKGAGCLQGEEKVKLAKELQFICRSFEVPFIINDDVELAVQINADGVHIGQEDTTVSEVRAIIGAERILGVSAHDVEEAKSAVDAGADYLGVGPMYPTKTKADTRAVQGPNVIRAIRHEGISIPIVGIGGINESNAAEVVMAGADGIAVISAISLADDPKASTQRLRKTVRTLEGFRCKTY
ncbi:thiamine phosphate synthase [Alkalihalobacillus sp. AL-G]|uniref:thiamine phosphate synthase n=1 Tax=Alkalihalobacillus sp. AL-G TaxID=2926399 RepID=UPI00272CC447|nr:thiamine phosphate synthase [Alkalihalobacillus sp. AL-G]WLD93899.1 thiamine phosphate synthase [Alkalihalobacillus sp. AL-G]